MSVSPSLVIGIVFQRTHEWMLQFVESLSEEELQRRPGVGAPSMAFHTWHSARWADLLQSKLPDMTPGLLDRLGSREQIWQADRLAEKWGLKAEELGTDATGMGMDGDVSAAFQLPARNELLAYLRRALASANEALAAVDETEMAEPCVDLYGRDRSVATVLLSHVTHLSRHLGMMEALRGLQGHNGTATV